MGGKRESKERRLRGRVAACEARVLRTHGLKICGSAKDSTEERLISASSASAAAAVGNLDIAEIRFRLAASQPGREGWWVGW